MDTLIDLFLHSTTHLAALSASYGPWIYALLFLIVFAETGLVVTPFLPGDSLLFAAGALAATGALNVYVLVAGLIVAAVLGFASNYAIGRRVGQRVFEHEASPTGVYRFVNRDYLARAHAFFEQYGAKAVVIGRFAPILRTFVPFVAGAAAMTPATFTFHNVAGGILWVGLCVGSGYLFGNVPIVKANFSLVALGIVFVSLIPVGVELLRARAGTRTKGVGAGAKRGPA